MSTVESQRWQDEILAMIDDPESVREDVAMIYGAALRCEIETIDWSKINHAILDRWSPAGLSYIKQWAWRRV